MGIGDQPQEKQGLTLQVYFLPFLVTCDIRSILLYSIFVDTAYNSFDLSCFVSFF